MTESHETKSRDWRYVKFAARIIVHLGAVIAVPVVVLSHAGRLLDSAYGTKPWLTVVGFVLSASFTAVTVRRRARLYGREYQALVDSEPRQPSSGW